MKSHSSAGTAGVSSTHQPFSFTPQTDVVYNFKIAGDERREINISKCVLPRVEDHRSAGSYGRVGRYEYRSFIVNPLRFRCTVGLF
ncbi:hypothetical protein BaRGS_00040504 [Batillaria attramentaria]|uniref:Uncharacterized protein n=1 Tax=Batillaria attramentaria TaxID=370345 RepID=A0ABD0IZU1_9CAEN